MGRTPLIWSCDFVLSKIQMQTCMYLSQNVVGRYQEYLVFLSIIHVVRSFLYNMLFDLRIFFIDFLNA